MVKRQMYGRASFTLLRKRVILDPACPPTKFAAEPVIPHGERVRVVVDLAIEMEQPSLPSGRGAHLSV